MESSSNEPSVAVKRIRKKRGGSFAGVNKSPVPYYMKWLVREVNCMVKSRSKSTSNESRHLSFGEYGVLETEKFSVAQLKHILRHYHQPLSGNKHSLLHRTYTYLRLSYFARKIQAVSRMYIVRTLVRLKGAATFDRSICVNDTDTVTMENISDVGFYDFVSIVDKRGCVYGFEVCSLANLYKMVMGNDGIFQVKNPYTRETIGPSVWCDLKRVIKLTQLVGGIVDTDFDSARVDTNDFDSVFNSRIISYCGQMDAMGHYTSLAWFLDMDRSTLARYMKHLQDIWEWRARLSPEARFGIIPVHGHPIPSSCRGNLSNHSLKTLKTALLISLRRLFSSADNEMQKLGAMYTLTALTLVNQTAADAMPVLYYSVAP